MLGMQYAVFLQRRIANSMKKYEDSLSRNKNAGYCGSIGKSSTRIGNGCAG